jgi:hypothetical protein
MKERCIFSGVARVEIQGDRVLRFDDDLTPERARYSVIGFEETPVTIFDHRPAGLRAIKEVLATGDVDQFAPQFNVPSLVEVYSLPPSGLLIVLREAEVTEPAYTLWIAIGIGDMIPVYDYVLEKMEPYGDERFALLALYRRPNQPEDSPLPVLSAAV